MRQSGSFPPHPSNPLEEREPRERLARASAWTAIAQNALLFALILTPFAYTFLPGAEVVGGALVFVAPLVALATLVFFCFESACLGDRQIRLFGTLGVVMGAVTGLLLLGMSLMPSVRGGTLLGLSVLGGLALVCCTDLVLSSLLRRLGSAEGAWIALGFALAMLLAAPYAAVLAWQVSDRFALLMVVCLELLLLVFVRSATTSSLLLKCARKLRPGPALPAPARVTDADPARERRHIWLGLVLAASAALAPVGMLSIAHIERCTTRLVQTEVAKDWHAWQLMLGDQAHRLGPFELAYQYRSHHGFESYDDLRIREPDQCPSGELGLTWFPAESPAGLRLRAGPQEFVVTDTETNGTPHPETPVIAFRRVPDGVVHLDAPWVLPVAATEFVLLLPLAVLIARCLAELGAARRVFSKRGPLTYVDGELLPNGLVQLADGSASFTCSDSQLRAGAVLISPEVVASCRLVAPGAPFRSSLPAGAGIIAASRGELIAAAHDALVQAHYMMLVCAALGMLALLLFSPVLLF